MIIWRGWGAIIVFAIPFSLSLFFNILGFSTENDLIFCIVLLISAVLVWVVGKWLNDRKYKAFLNAEFNGNAETTIKNYHTLFFIPIQYWGIVLFVVLVVPLFRNI